MHHSSLCQNTMKRKLLKWLEFVSNVRLDNFAKFRICNLHFEDTCFRKKYPRPLLLMGSIPTLKSFTGHANEKINKSKPTNESSTSSPTDAVDSTSSPTDAVDSTSSPTDAVDSTSSPTDAVDSTLSPTDAADTISSIDMNQVITDSIEKSESLYDHEDNSEESKRARFQIDIDVPSTCKVVVYEKIQTWERHFTSIIRNTFHCKNVCKNLMAFNRDCCPQITLCSDETTTVFLKNFMTIRCHWEARFMRQELKHSEKRPNKATQTKKERLIINGL
ncbi:uncharacterized protein LOC105207002 isoform X2 [Solenopsis invicta]|uniref:uncharacterized protein LOC105207002 isoform X2 n=1 Tax=Solenopsis invicta TaxID=13686 RepID=UPI00193EA1F0|nr:uncharacterized protein LOC105207002 isoform X2 [Solenopsis invicta]